MTSCHLHSETRIYCEFRENKSQAANWSKAKPFQMASLRGFWNAVTKIYTLLFLYSPFYCLYISSQTRFRLIINVVVRNALKNSA